MSSFFESIQEIRREARSRLGGLDVRDPRFSLLAREILTGAELGEFQFEDLTDARLWGEPRQSFPRTEFSDLPLTLWREASYFLDLYIWIRSDTDIHDHHFAGAFRILRGSYLQIEYAFEGPVEALPELQRGVLRSQRNRQLGAGETQEIALGSGFIHQVFHGNVPCVTLCLRSNVTEPHLHSYVFPRWRFAHRPWAFSTTGKLAAVSRALLDGKAHAAASLGGVTLPEALGFTLSRHSSYGLQLCRAWWELLSETYPEHRPLLDELAQDLRTHSRRFLVTQAFVERSERED